jgi:type III restriction enzyme
VRALETLVDDMTELLVSRGRTDGELVRWLDSTIHHPDITPTDAQLFVVRLVRKLIDGRGLTLEFLLRDMFRLRQAVERKIDVHRAAAKTKAFFQLVMDVAHRPELSVSPERCFTYDAQKYPNGLVCERWREFNRHLFPRAGEMNDEEFDCAKFLDGELDVVQCWVRNIERRPGDSFWLQTSTDKFYPDFVCRLTDGRILVVEYKGEDRWSNDDSKEKRTIGELWESLSGGRCLFIMPKGKNLEAIRAKITAKP